jgi:hypothetical protein
MEADLNNNFEYDKIVINLDSRNGINGNGNDFGCYFKFDDTIKNPIAVQVIDATVISSASATYQSYDDCFYVLLNNIERSTSYIKDSNNNFNIVKYLEKVEYTDNSTANSKNKSVTHIGTSTGSFSDSGTYMFNPVIPTLGRFELTLKDKNFANISNANIDSVKLSLCIYTLKKIFS